MDALDVNINSVSDLNSELLYGFVCVCALKHILKPHFQLHFHNNTAQINWESKHFQCDESEVCVYKIYI